VNIGGSAQSQVAVQAVADISGSGGAGGRRHLRDRVGSH
jgi:hypothetical protein